MINEDDFIKDDIPPPFTGEVSLKVTEGARALSNAPKNHYPEDESFAYPLRPLRGHLPRPGGGGVMSYDALWA